MPFIFLLDKTNKQANKTFIYTSKEQNGGNWSDNSNSQSSADPLHLDYKDIINLLHWAKRSLEVISS